MTIVMGTPGALGSALVQQQQAVLQYLYALEEEAEGVVSEFCDLLGPLPPPNELEDLSMKFDAWDVVMQGSLLARNISADYRAWKQRYRLDSWRTPTAQYLLDTPLHLVLAYWWWIRNTKRSDKLTLAQCLFDGAPSCWVCAPTCGSLEELVRSSWEKKSWSALLKSTWGDHDQEHWAHPELISFWRKVEPPPAYNPNLYTREEWRAATETYADLIEELARILGFVQPKSKHHGEHFHLLARYQLGLTLQGESTGAREMKAIERTADLIGIELPPGQGRKKTSPK